MIVRVLGSGRPLVNLHGFDVDHRIMLPLADAVQDLPWRLVLLDPPWAEAAAATATAKSAVDVADEVLADVYDHLGDEPFVIIGNSLGGMIARNIAHDRRDHVLGVAILAVRLSTRQARQKVSTREQQRAIETWWRAWPAQRTSTFGSRLSKSRPLRPGRSRSDLNHDPGARGISVGLISRTTLETTSRQSVAQRTGPGPCDSAR